MSAPDLAQAARLELALRALESGDRPAFVGALASLDTASFELVTRLARHPVWAALVADLIPPVIPE